MLKVYMQSIKYNPNLKSPSPFSPQVGFYLSVLQPTSDLGTIQARTEKEHLVISQAFLGREMTN